MVITDVQAEAKKPKGKTSKFKSKTAQDNKFGSTVLLLYCYILFYVNVAVSLDPAQCAVLNMLK